MKNTFQSLAPSMPSRIARPMRTGAREAQAVRSRSAGIALHAPPPHA